MTEGRTGARFMGGAAHEPRSLKRGPAHHELVWTFHHAILDGRSCTLLRKEIFAFHEAACHGISVEIPLPCPIRDHLEYIVSDAWSVGVFHRELSALYGAFLHCRSSPLVPLPVQYPDFALWQNEWLRGRVLEDLFGYWTDKLANAPSELVMAEVLQRLRSTVIGCGRRPVRVTGCASSS